jgi:hypothetical protein
MMQGYILIAVGQRYIDEVCKLINTLRKQNDHRPVTVVIGSNDIDYFNNKNIDASFTLLRDVDGNLDYYQTEFEIKGMYPKVNIYHFAPYDENIFLDTDVVVQCSTEDVWNYLSSQSQPIVMTGRKRDPHWYWGTITNVSRIFGKHVPHTHGGFIYFRKPETEQFYQFASEIVKRHDELGGLRHFRGSMADEFIYALSFAQFRYQPVDFDEYPIITFNIPAHQIPSKLQTADDQSPFPTKKEFDKYIPFIHMFYREMHEATYRKIME